MDKIGKVSRMEGEGPEKITIADVADALGVSKTTVSRAISGKGRIGAATRQRVLDYIEAHDYKPNVIAKGLAQSKTYNLCAVMPGEYDIVDLNFFQECLFGIQETAGVMEYDVLISICKRSDLSPLERIISNHKVDGIILMRTYMEDPQIEFLQQKKMHFVTIGSTLYPDVVQVDHSHKNACKELTLILLMKQFKRIALLGGDEGHFVNQSRLYGFREAYEEIGEKLDESMIYMNCDGGSYAVERSVNEALEKKADCILCMDDAVAGHVLRILREEHIKVPADIRVASFYNSMILENNIPSVTSLSFDARELGQVACRTLLDMIEGKSVEPCRLLPYEVVLKESTK